ncbi:MAG TPA: hypothetical protein VK463_11570 [Desulfomonilaceae bacterium]|nr:hypothetical protein [Desulfomonilaceae bacterium]
MNVKLDIRQFVKDYCDGVKDRELLIKHNIGAKDLVRVVKKLISDGTISKEAYFDRSRKIEEFESRQEKNFLKSLFHCPVCSHIHPVPFDVCPSCGTDIAAYERAQKTEEESLPVQERHADELPPPVAEPGRVVAPKPGPPVLLQAQTPPVEPVVEPAGLPEVLVRKIGMDLENLVLLVEAPDEFHSGEYRVTGIVRNGQRAAVFRAEDLSKNSPAIAVKRFHSDVLSVTGDEFLNNLVAYQSGMNDPNVLEILGYATLGEDRVLLYPYFGENLETVLQRCPEGLPLETFAVLLPQILNAVGYSHMHRSRDGVIRRLAHGYLKLSEFLVNEKQDTIKLDGCGVLKSLVETRGHKRHLWEEPGRDLSSLAPEAFVLDSKFVNMFYVDMYALGAALYRLTTGKHAFLAGNVEEYSFAHLRTFPVPPRVHRYLIPAWLDGMILRALEKDPAKRWRSATQMELAVGKDLL